MDKKLKYCTIAYLILLFLMIMSLGMLIVNSMLQDKAIHIFTLLGFMGYFVGLVCFPVGFFGLITSFKLYQNERSKMNRNWMVFYSISYSFLICLIILFVYLS